MKVAYSYRKLDEQNDEGHLLMFEADDEDDETCALDGEPRTDSPLVGTSCRRSGKIAYVDISANRVLYVHTTEFQVRTVQYRYSGCPVHM